MKPASIWDWLGPSALMTAFIIFLAVTVPTEMGWCAGSENCVREWVGALSGWAAAIAAAATIIILVRQLHTQQRQTDFQLGDALPTFDATLHEFTPDFPHVVMTNWNRRRVAIRSVEVVSPKAAAVVKAWHGMGNAKFQGSVAIINPAWTIEGWINRAESPPQSAGGIIVAPAGQPPIVPWETVSIRFTFTLAGLGEFVSEVPVHRAKLVVQAAGEMTIPSFNSGG